MNTAFFQFFKHLAFALLLAIPCALQAGKTGIPAHYRVERDITYLGTNRTEKADLYLPTNLPQGALCPAVIVIHGGGWGAGGKGDGRERGFCMALVDNGFAAFSIDYHLSPPKCAKEAWPQNMYDCKTAVRWLRQHAPRFGIDPERIGVMGGSAGGHLASLLGVAGPDSGLEPKEPLGEVSCRVSAVVDLYGPILIGTGPVPAGDIPPDSPLKYLGKQSPPFLLLHGTEDKGVPIARSREFAAALKQAGVEYELIEVEGAKHSFGLQLPDRDLRPVVMAFLSKHLNGKTPAALHAAETAPKGEHILVEAEAFSSLGGWVVDPQFMDIMGSPYLLAHGLGRPVADATTEIDVPVAGSYRVWVRTKDWVAQWKAPGAPGKFHVLVKGEALEPTFGTVGAQWHWQEGGSVELPAGKVAVALHDLTGFEGRCDSILFSRDAQFVPPNADPEMAVFRRTCLGLPEQPESAGEFDFVVTGGGIAGTCAALSAARLGLKVALIQDRPVLGGNNSSEVRVWLQGARNKEPWPRIGDVVSELEQMKSAHYGPSNTKEIYEDEKKLALVRAEKNITLVLDHRVNAAEVVDGRIRAVIAQSTTRGRRLRFVAKCVADCTGDGAVGALAGADFEVEPKGHMGPCNLWNVSPSKDAVSFPRCPWALALSDKPFPGRNKKKPDPNKLGGWYWESGFDRDPMQEMEYVRDWNFRAMYGAWDALKNVDKVLPDYTLNWSAYILGKRESRRLMGDVVLDWDDLVKDRQFPDAAAPTGWSNDLHLPDPAYEKGFKGDAFISRAHFGEFPAHKEKRPFWIPYRALYSRNISNLFMAGRNISVKHEALGAVRVMRTGGCMGEVVGMAASLCVKHDVLPRTVYEKHLSELQDLMRHGTGKRPASRAGIN